MTFMGRIRLLLVAVLALLSLSAGTHQAFAGHSIPFEHRQDVKKKTRLPRPRAKYKDTVGMGEYHKRTDKETVRNRPPVHKYSRKENKDHEIHVRNGLLHKKDRKTGQLVPFDSGSRRPANFVMKHNGKIIADSRHTSSKGRPIHHSSLAKGKRVAAAGEMVVRNGRLESINNQSGHYFPTAHHHS